MWKKHSNQQAQNPRALPPSPRPTSSLPLPVTPLLRPSPLPVASPQPPPVPLFGRRTMAKFDFASMNFSPPPQLHPEDRMDHDQNFAQVFLHFLVKTVHDLSIFLKLFFIFTRTPSCYRGLSRRKSLERRVSTPRATKNAMIRRRRRVRTTASTSWLPSRTFSHSSNGAGDAGEGPR